MIVTVCVSSYNSRATVLETLESVYNQTYPSIALIISDDASKDDTLNVINNWTGQEKVKNRFQSIELITVPVNTGVSANSNRIVKAVQTDWFKVIAGDDLLFPNCIADNVNFVLENPNAKIIFSQIKTYRNTFEEVNYVTTTPGDYSVDFMDARLTALDQYQLLLVADRIHYTPSFFSNKHAIVAAGCYDEENRMVEDYPMWLKLTRAGERLYYFHKITVGYRIHANAINNVGDDALFKPSKLNNFGIRKTMCHPYLPWEIVYWEKFIHSVSLFFQKMNWNHKTRLNEFLFNVACFYLNPFHYVYIFKKKFTSAKNSNFYK